MLGVLIHTLSCEELSLIGTLDAEYIFHIIELEVRNIHIIYNIETRAY